MLALVLLLLLLLLLIPRVHGDIIPVPVGPRVRGFGPSRGKTIIIIFACGLPLLLKIIPVVRRMTEAVVTPDPISMRAFRWG